MRTDGHDDELRRYLLGELSEPDAAAVELRYFADPDLLERIRGVENDLVDDYAADRLRPRQRAAFERSYLASREHEERVAVARALRAVARAGGSPTRRWPALGPALAAAVAAGVLVVLGLTLSSRSRPPSVAGPEAPMAPLPSPAGSMPAPASVRAPAPARLPAVVAFTVSPLLMRGGGEARRLRLGPGVEEVHLRVEGEQRARGPLTFTLRAVGGEELASGQAMAEPRTPGSRAVATVVLAASLLSPDDYVLTVSGPRGNAPARYYFRVVTPLPREPDRGAADTNRATGPPASESRSRAEDLPAGDQTVRRRRATPEQGVPR